MTAKKTAARKPSHDGAASGPKPRAPAEPSALAQRAAALAAKKREQDKTRALELIDLVRRRKARIAEDFYEIGEALSKLRAAALYGALGYASFAALVEKELGISDSQAYRLVAVAEQLPRARALALGPERAAALVQLARATPDADTAESLAHGKIKIPGRKAPVDPIELTAEEIALAARKQRRKAGRPERSAEVSAAEQQADRWEQALRTAGLRRARVRVVLFRSRGEPPVPEIRLEGVPFAGVAKLVGVLGKAK